MTSTDPQTMMEMQLASSWLDFADEGVLPDPEPLSVRPSQETNDDALRGDLVELIGLVVAIENKAPLTIAVQQQLCLAAGVDPSVIDSLLAGREPLFAERDQALAIGLAQSMVTTGAVAPRLEVPARSSLGAAGIAELMALVDSRSALSRN